MMADLVRFQDNLHNKDPIKAKVRKRYVVGLREVKKFLTVNKVTMLVLAPDIEPVKVKGGLNDLIQELIDLARANEIPVVFALNRYKLGKACLRKAAVSCIGVMNYQGSEVLSKCSHENSPY